MAVKRRTKSQRLADYIELYETAKPFLKKGTLVPPSKFKTSWHEQKAINYVNKIADLKGQAVTFVRPKKKSRLRSLKREFGGSELPGLNGAFVPAFKFGDKVTIKYDAKDNYIQHSIKSVHRKFTYHFYPVDFSTQESEAEVRRDINKTIRQGKEDGANVFGLKMGRYDSRFDVRVTDDNHVDKMFEYVLELLERYSEITDTGELSPNHYENWLFGIVGFGVKGSVPKRVKSARRRDTEISVSKKKNRSRIKKKAAKLKR